MGLPSCIKTTPIPFHEASHSTIKAHVNSSVANTGAWCISSLICPKAIVSNNVNFETGTNTVTCFVEIAKESPNFEKGGCRTHIFFRT